MATQEKRILSADLVGKRPAQQPVLPWEVTDRIIDFLSTDVASLGACGAVCTEWLARSRFLLFSTVQLWPWRVRNFLRLAQRPYCTFTTCIRSIELDDAQTRPARAVRQGRERSLSPARRRRVGEEAPPMMFAEAMAHYVGLSCFVQLGKLEIRNVDWTKMRLEEREMVRAHLAMFSRLSRLEFRDVAFQDIREVVRITGLFSELQHLTTDVTFAKYLEHTLSEAPKYPISNIVSLEIGRDDSIPVILSCIHNSVHAPSSIRHMSLKNIRTNHLRYIQQFLQSRTAAHLHTLSLQFDITDKAATRVFEDDAFSALDFSCMSALRTVCIGGLPLLGDQIISSSLPSILSRVEAAFLLRVDLYFRLDSVTIEGAAAAAADWQPLQKTLLSLHFFGVKEVHLEVEVGGETMPAYVKVDALVRAWLPELEARGVLSVSVLPSGRMEAVQDSQKETSWDEEEEEENGGTCA